MWAEPQPIAPWDWRASQRAKTGSPPAEIEVVANGVHVIALLPIPAGEDAGNEQVTIGNGTDLAVDLSGWKLIDEAGNVFLLSGQIEPGKSLVVTMTEPTMPLNNDGDVVVLVDADGVGRSRVEFDGSQARSGAVVQFGR